MKHRKLTPAIAAEVTDIDLSQPLAPETFADVSRLLTENGVLVFPDQSLSPQAQLAFSRMLGEVKMPPLLSDYAVEGCPQVLRVSNIMENGKHIGNPDAGVFWHSDGAYEKVPSMYSLLYAIEVPSKDGKNYGDTLWASTAAAWEALPEDMKRRVGGLRARHSLRHQYEKKKAANFLRRADMTRDEAANVVPEVAHPVARTHPLSGRKCLFVNEGHTFGIEGMSDENGAAMVAELAAWCTKTEFTYRHNWRTGDLVVWDNCSTQHRATFDYELPMRRLMYRTTVEGTPTF
jgi:taurine dioxygenase